MYFRLDRRQWSNWAVWMYEFLSSSFFNLRKTFLHFLALAQVEESELLAPFNFPKKCLFLSVQNEMFMLSKTFQYENRCAKCQASISKQSEQEAILYKNWILKNVFLFLFWDSTELSLVLVLWVWKLRRLRFLSKMKLNEKFLFFILQFLWRIDNSNRNS